MAKEKNTWWVVVRAVLTGLLLIGIFHTVRISLLFDGTCGFYFGHQACSVIEFIAGELPLFVLLSYTAYWHLSLSVIALSIILSFYLARRKKKK